MDGEGDLLSATVSLCQNGKIERISSTSWQNSAGYLYSEVTKRCGYKMSNTKENNWLALMVIQK